MDTSKKEQEEVLDFSSFIKNYFPAYQIDGNNAKVIAQLGLWANRNPKFNGAEEGWHIDRGVLIYGPVGVGKDEIFRILRKYISYLHSPYGYSAKVVWEFAKPFLKDGYECFNEQKGNIYYEELALTDELSGQPTREVVTYYGNKILIGAEIINIRYKTFKETGWQTHFSTNLNEEELEGVYGKRCMSRLYEMCNFIAMPGRDRRGSIVPEFKENKNQPKRPDARETTIEEHWENRTMLEKEYRNFCETGAISSTAAISYNLLTIYGCKLQMWDRSDPEVILIERDYSEPSSAKLKTASQREEDKKAWVWSKLRELSVKIFYIKLKEGGAKSIFEEVEVNIGNMIGEIEKNIKA